MPKGRAQQGAAGCWETLSFRFVFPCGVPSDPLWNLFLLAQSLGFHLTTPISSSYSSHPWPSLTFLQHLPIFFPSLYPFPSICSQLLHPSPFHFCLPSPLFRIFIPITLLCTSPSLPNYLFPKPFPMLSPSQPSVLHLTYSQPHSDSQEPVPSRVPLLSFSIPCSSVL